MCLLEALFQTVERRRFTCPLNSIRRIKPLHSLPPFLMCRLHLAVSALVSAPCLVVSALGSGVRKCCIFPWVQCPACEREHDLRCTLTSFDTSTHAKLCRWIKRTSGATKGLGCRCSFSRQAYSSTMNMRPITQNTNTNICSVCTAIYFLLRCARHCALLYE